MSQVCDYLLIGSGTSERQMKSVAAELEDLAENSHVAVFRRAQDLSRTWVVIDFVDVVAHLFEPNQRAFYDLETLWEDARMIDWRRPDQKKQRTAAWIGGNGHAPHGPPGVSASRRDEAEDE
jgi:ribosome-associated protein